MTQRPFDLHEKVAAIFGGTGGIGAAITRGLADAGAAVVPISRDPAHVAQTLEALQDQGASVLALQADVTDCPSVRLALEKILNRFGRVDILVNSAGTHARRPSLEVTQTEWDTVIDVNLKGTFLTCQVFGAQMIAQRNGCVINIASLGAHVALSEAAAYCASKAGVVALSRCLAVEWAPFNVRVNTITPGVVATRLNEAALADPARLNRILTRTPLHRLGQADEIVGAAVYLASDGSRFVTGTDLVVDGGFLACGI